MKAPSVLPSSRPGRRVAIAGAVAVLSLGAVLTFVLAGGSAGVFDLRITGVILMLAGALGLLLLLLHVRSRWSQSTARSRQDAIDDRPPPGRP
ncbi:hypothetical protein E1267_25805 [Nonomuraea longispora]|uniref:Uncharacterized protein n=1 Tax=Nonomuraea longispora TaxID=1848320 RepID=A0A4R4N8U3_9ACTN|nr:hypothetical protein [Nonomuraea longispora]TDC03610.1 hypothetical protein E1267_25805 [Nonomuraea longispora]